MMFFLVFNVFTNRINLQFGMCKHDIPFLPIKFLCSKLVVVYPFIATRFYGFHQFRNSLIDIVNT
jgi:hypothetical protein